MVGDLTMDLAEVYISPIDMDARIWCPTSSEKFSVKSFYSILSAENNSKFPILVRNIWKSLAPPRVCTFSWLACFNRLNTMDVL